MQESLGRRRAGGTWHKAGPGRKGVGQVALSQPPAAQMPSDTKDRGVAHLRSLSHTGKRKAQKTCFAVPEEGEVCQRGLPSEGARRRALSIKRTKHGRLSSGEKAIKVKPGLRDLGKQCWLPASADRQHVLTSRRPKYPSPKAGVWQTVRTRSQASLGAG